jgi:hypothetical protein
MASSKSLNVRAVQLPDWRSKTPQAKGRRRRAQARVGPPAAPDSSAHPHAACARCHGAGQCWGRRRVSVLRLGRPCCCRRRVLQSVGGERIACCCIVESIRGAQWFVRTQLVRTWHALRPSTHISRWVGGLSSRPATNHVLTRVHITCQTQERSVKSVGGSVQHHTDPKIQCRVYILQAP